MSDSSGDDISFTPSQLRKYLDSRRHPQRNIKLKTEATVVPDGLGLRSHQNHGGLGRWRSNTAKPTIGSSRQGGLSAFSSGTEQRTSPKPRGSGLLTAWDRNAARNSSSDDDDDERLRSRASALAHALRQRRSGVAPALQQGLSWRQREASPAINTAEQKPLNISPGLGRGTLSATNTDAPLSGARDRHTSPTAASFYLGTSEERFGAAPRSPAATAPLSLQQALSTPTSPARSRVLEQEPSSPYGSRATGNAQGSQLSPQSARPSTAPRLRAYADAPEAYMGASPSSPLRTMRPDRNATGFYNDEPYSSTHGTGLGTLKALSASVPDASAGRSPGAAAAAFPQAYGSGNSNLLGLVVGNPLPDTYTGSSAVRSTRSPPMSPKAALDDGRYTSPGRGGLGLLGATDAYTPGVTSFSFPVQDQQPAAGLSRQASRLDARDAATSPRQPGDYGSARHESPSRVPIERSDREASPTGSFGGLSRVRPISSITEELDNLMRNVTAMGGGRGGPSRSGSPLRGPAGGLAQSPSPRGRDTGGTPSSPLASRSALGSPRRPDAGSGGIQSVLSQLATIKRDMDQLRDNVLKERGADGTAALTASSPGAGLAALTLATGGPPSPRRLSWSNPGSPTFTDISSLSLSRKTPRRGRSPSQRYIASSASPTSPPRQSGPAQGGIPLPPMQSATAQMHTPFADLRALGPDLLPPQQQQQRRLVQEPEHIDGILAELRSIRHDLSALGDPATGGLESAASGLSRRSRSASPHFSQPSPGPSSGHRGNRRDSSSGGEGGREESSRMRPRASSPRAGRYQPDRVEEEQRRDTDAAWRRLVAAVDPVGLRSSAASPAQQQAARAAEQSPSRRSRDAAAGPYGRSSPNSPLISPLRASTVLRSTPGAAQKTSAGTPAPAATQKKAGGSAEAQSASRDGQRGGAGGMTALMLGSMPDGRVRIQEDPGPEPAPPVPLSSSSLALFSSQKQRALDDLMHGFGQTMKTSISAEPPSTDGAAGGSEREPASRARAASPITTRTLQADMPLAAAAALQGSGDRTRPAAAGRSPSSRQRGPAAEAAAEARGDPWVSSVLGDSRGNAGRSRGSRYAPPMRDLDVEGSHQADLARIMSAGVRTSQRRTEDAAPGLPQPAGGRQTSTPSAAAERPQIGRMQSQSSGQRDPESLASLSLNSNPAIPVGGISKSLEQALNRLLPARATADGARGTNAGDSSSPSGPGGQSSGSRRAQLNAESLSRLRGSVWSFGGAPQSPVPRRKLDTSVGGAPGASTSSVGKGSDRRSIAPLNPADLLPFTADHTVHRYRAPSSDSQSLALEQLRRQGGSPAASPRGRTMERGRTTDSAGAQEEAQATGRLRHRVAW
ncbi:hypothetical protein Agub_g4659 [Astrephomene gubernaculifera]|uniref:Uncharacterized protein n=1 Tax=Astrephomene gubernaculifera TaxID=47775 RepID=A0AAD3HKD5_9CHLO|nr:hypothetical protein Agub_g4659 [Astrephomene gubernaculifera]